MTDHFAVLAIDRRPWLEAEDVNARFLELSAGAHPDRIHGATPEEMRAANEAFAKLNVASSCLRDPKERLQHLLALETGAPASSAQTIPPEVMGLFGKVGDVCRAADHFIAERARATSPMLQAQLFAQGLDLSDRVSELQASVGKLRADAEAELKGISEHWPKEKSIERLKTLSYIIATTGRWESQLRERFAALAS